MSEHTTLSRKQRLRRLAGEIGRLSDQDIARLASRRIASGESGRLTDADVRRLKKRKRKK